MVKRQQNGQNPYDNCWWLRLSANMNEKRFYLNYGYIHIFFMCHFISRYQRYSACCFFLSLSVCLLFRVYSKPFTQHSIQLVIYYIYTIVMSSCLVILFIYFLTLLTYRWLMIAQFKDLRTNSFHLFVLFVRYYICIDNRAAKLVNVLEITKHWL